MASYLFQRDHEFIQEYSIFSQHSHPDLFPEWEGRWSDWITAIEPQKRNNFTRRKRCGFRLKSQVLKQSVPRFPGLYELAVCDDFEIDGRVYLGQSKDLLRRILEYCRNGSHKHEKIDEAVNCGYPIAMRYLNISSPNEAQRAEKKALSAYTYPWNIVYYNGLGDNKCYVIDVDDSECNETEGYDDESDDSEDDDGVCDESEDEDDQCDKIEGGDDIDYDDIEDHDAEWEDSEVDNAKCDDVEVHDTECDESEYEYDDIEDHDAEWDDSD